jgi:predicted acyltransferase
VLSLDILRGLFLLIMTLGFTIEPEIFPAWMYHRQFPPPEHVLVEIPGITWRDLAYPAFLFIMAAALPITISKRIERGIQGPALILAILKRGALLFLFALLIGHADSDTVGEYGARARVVGVAGFAIMFMIFTRRLPEWNARIFEIARAAGWPLALAFLILSPLLYHQTFSFARRDQIIEDLAFAAVAGSVLWYVTRSNAGARLVALGLLLSAFLWAQEDGRLGAELSRLSLDTLVDHLQLLAVVVPGTIAGDLLLRLLRSRKADHEARAAWSTGRLRVIAALGVVPTPILLVGLYNEWVGATSILVLSLIGAGTILVSRPATQTEQVVRRLVLWASFWLALGILLQPLEGGMKKVPGTFSYFFTMSGNTFFLLAALAVLVDLFGYRKWMGAFKKVGQNPMLCYVLFRVFLDSALDLVPPIGSLLHGGSPVEAIVRSFTIVLIVTVVVRAATERRILWRT